MSKGLSITNLRLNVAATGNDIVDGGGGGDTLFASVNDGDDTYRGGAGTDTYSLANTTANATVDLLLEHLATLHSRGSG